MKRNVALIIDNCLSHPKLGGLTHTPVFYVPPQTTSVTQPMDSGVIKCLKVNYRNDLLRENVLAVESVESFAADIYEAIKMVYKAWNKVKPETVEHCSSHAAVSFDKPDLVFMGSQADNNEFFSILRGQEARDSVTIEDFYNADDDVLTVRPAVEFEYLIRSTYSQRSGCNEDHSVVPNNLR